MGAEFHGLWLLVGIAMFIGGAITLGLSALLAWAPWWYGFGGADARVTSWAQAGLVFWVLAAMGPVRRGPGPARYDSVGTMTRAAAGPCSTASANQTEQSSGESLAPPDRLAGRYDS